MLKSSKVSNCNIFFLIENDPPPLELFCKFIRFGTVIRPKDRIIILYLGVRLATVGADVSLNMFRIAMLGDVLQEGGLVREALVAGVALVRLVALVAPRVGLQVGQLGERLRATWQERK